MYPYIIATDSCADLPVDVLTKYEVPIVNLSYTLDDTTYTKDNQIDLKFFYGKMREDSTTSTSQVNPEEAKEFFEEILKKDKNILYIAFSSGLSGTYNSGVIAANEIKEEDPEANIVCVDSLSASMGQGLLVYKALMLREEGKSLNEVVDWIKEYTQNFVHIFTVDDLKYLYRGGRLSKTSAFMGTVLNIKPVLHVDSEGKLVAMSKVRGRKKALVAMVDEMEKKIGSYKDKNDIVFISHADALEDAEFVKNEVSLRFGINAFIINYICPTIGAHSGPGTVALFFMGDDR